MIDKLRGRSAFLALRSSRNTARSGAIRITFADVCSDRPRVAFAISRKVGGAVVRNRIRRRLRVVNQELAPMFSPGAYLVIVLPEAVDMSFEDLKKCTESALLRLRRLRETT